MSRAPGSRPARSKYDWEAIERDYRTGKYTLRELAAKHGPCMNTIHGRVRRYGWAQDMADVVRVATQAEIARKVLADQGYVEAAQATLQETVTALAEIGAKVDGAHRKVLHATRGALTEMGAELAVLNKVSRDPDNVRKVAEAIRLTDEEAIALLGSTKLGFRVQVADKLVGALTKLVAQERQVYALDKTETANGFDELLAKALKE